MPTARVHPGPAARMAVALAARVLPTVEARDRYRAEFLADLHELSVVAQFRYAAGVLSQTFALRAALGDDPRRIEQFGMTPQAPLWRSVRCRVLRMHYWRGYSTDDGSRYVACSVCRREHLGGGGGSLGGAWGALGGGGGV